MLLIALLLLFPSTAAAAPDPIVLLGPADGATIYDQYSPPVLTWQPATDGGGPVSELRLFFDGTKYDLYPHSTSSSQRGPDWHWPNPLQMSPGEHEWRVESADADGNVTSSDTRSFTFVLDSVKPEYFDDAWRAPANGSILRERPTLRWKPTTDALSGVVGQEIYVNGRSVATLGPDATSFTPTPEMGDGEWWVTAVDRAGNARWNDRWTYIVDQHAPSVHLSASTDRALTGTMITFTASAFDGVAIGGWEWDFDGDGDFETAGGRETSHVFTTPGVRTVGVRVTDTAQNSRIETMKVQIDPAPPVGIVGVSINDGARFTNSPHVTLKLRWPPFSDSLIVANDGGFAGSTQMPVAETIPWTLDSSGAERLPKTVYVRFSGGSDATFQDDIILDETAPRISLARVRGRRLTVRAGDATSGVAMLQLARDRRRPARPVAFRRALRVRTRPRYVRVTDVAGNRSAWRRVASRP